jgi:hypothetical protein
LLCLVRCRAQNGQPCLNSTGGNLPLKGGFACLTSPLAAITAFAEAAGGGGAKVVSAQGCEVNSDKDDVAAAVAAAKAADVAVLLVGIDGSIEAEGRDRYAIGLPGVQPKLLAAVLASGTPTVVVLLHGGATSLGPGALAALADPRQAHALLDAPYGGEMGGQAIADVIFGVYNPTGRLTNTVYPAGYVGEIPLTDMSLTGGPGRTYMYYNGTAPHELGDGLAYGAIPRSFPGKHPGTAGAGAGAGAGAAGGGVSPEPATAMAAVMHCVMSTAGSAAFNVTVSNRGAVGGGARVLAFWQPKAPWSMPRAPTLRRKLFAFDGVSHLGAGEEAALTFELPAAALALSDDSGERAVVAGEYEVVFEAGSGGAPALLLTAEVTVTGPAAVVESYAL